MFLTEHEYYHVYNRGNNHQRIFFTHANYLFFIRKIRAHLLPVADIIAYCLMPNHFHLVVRANDKTICERKSFGGKPMQEFAYRLGVLLSSYTQAINKQNKTSGSLFQQKTKCKCLTGKINNERFSYLENCVMYIHANPVAAKLVTDISEWPYSSYPDCAGLRKGTLCSKELLFAETGLSEEGITNWNEWWLTVEDANKFL